MCHFSDLKGPQRTKVCSDMSFYRATIYVLKLKNVSWNYLENLHLGVSLALTSQPAPDQYVHFLLPAFPTTSPGSALLKTGSPSTQGLEPVCHLWLLLSPASFSSVARPELLYFEQLLNSFRLVPLSQLESQLLSSLSWMADIFPCPQ